MKQNKLSLWVHLVWGVKKREFLITDELQPALFYKMDEIADSKGYDIVEKNAMPDHVHLLVRLNPTHSISDIMKNIKGSTAHWINQQGLDDTKFEWQDGYGAFTVSSFMVKKVISYIQNQQQHHTNNDFENEIKYLEILGKDI